MDQPKILTRQIVVRVPGWLYEEVQADAERHGRTVAQSVRFILAKALNPPDS